MVRWVFRTAAFGACCLVAACGVSSRHAHIDRHAGAGLAVESLRITENGAASPEVEARGCEGFVIDEPTARQALEAGEAISRDQYMHHLPWSPCLARGRVVLADGREGTWTVRQYGTGSVILDDGAEWFLWCRSCSNPPFVEIE